ncbi:hypothetical protein BBJ28_00012731 [Nothophytophthora sp. Chile5]|nr:hypothetical protein BBJ28_00012731 [Nothophytophthora sp. Chile5]
MSTSRDHPVFRRLSREQLVVRRRSLGLQALVLDPCFASSRKSQCKQCGRRFSAVWKSYLCHLCGRWVCEPCSSVVERERELQCIRFVRCCVPCLKMINKLPDAELLVTFLLVPSVVASSNSQLGLHLADALRTNKELRPAVLVLLNYLGRPIGANAGVLKEIREEDWAAATALVSAVAARDSSERTKSGKEVHREKRRDGDSGAHPGNAEWVQFLVQQCFEVSLVELPLSECVVAEADGRRQYPIFYDEDTDFPFAPNSKNEEACEACIVKYNLLGRGIADQIEVKLICLLAAKELNAMEAIVTIVQGDKLYALTLSDGSSCVSTDRAKSFSAHAVTSDMPFLVRHSLLDVRFRNFVSALGHRDPLLSYVAFPIIALETDTVMALLCVGDLKPRKSITTMQYTVLKKLAEILASLLTN